MMNDFGSVNGEYLNAGRLKHGPIRLRGGYGFALLCATLDRAETGVQIARSRVNLFLRCWPQSLCVKEASPRSPSRFTSDI